MEHLRGRIRNYNSRLRRLLREGGTEIVQLLVARPVAKLHKKRSALFLKQCTDGFQAHFAKAIPWFSSIAVLYVLSSRHDEVDFH